MFEDFERYAVYWIPRFPDPLGPFGDSWTGWCAEHGERHARSDFPDLPALTRRLCRHGLHGVIHAPFRLSRERSIFAVEDALDEIAEETVAVRIPPLELAVVEGRVALVPSHASVALTALLDRVASMLEPMVEPAAEAVDAPALSAGGDSLVPFRSGAAHRFHLPLTDPRPIDEAYRLKEALAPVVAHVLDVPRSVSVISLIGDPAGGRKLRALESYGLLDSPLRPGARVLPSHGPQVLAPMPQGRRKSDMAL